MALVSLAGMRHATERWYGCEPERVCMFYDRIGGKDAVQAQLSWKEAP